MRQHVDLAVLCQQINHPWFYAQIAAIKRTLNRIELHELPWERTGEFAAEYPENMTVGIRSDLLAHAGVRLRRYDAILIPVSLQTLGWTRRLLACAPKAPFIPVIGVLHELRSSAMIDLLELGMIDFVQTPVSDEELRARVLCSISRSPRRVSLRDSAQRHARDTEQRSTQAEPQIHRHMCASGKAFNEAKSELITQFETQYIRDALAMQKGNVTRAAAAAGKNRRAFWELMRKYKIEAAEFREESLHKLGHGRLPAR